MGARRDERADPGVEDRSEAADADIAGTNGRLSDVVGVVQQEIEDIGVGTEVHAVKAAEVRDRELVLLGDGGADGRRRVQTRAQPADLGLENSGLEVGTKPYTRRTR
jgi:hypothetical protein